MGDLTSFDERKMAMYAAKHAVATLRALAAGRPPTTTYTPGTGEQTMLVTLGRGDGVCHLPGLGAVRLPFLARLLKSDGVMVPKYRKRVGLG